MKTPNLNRLQKLIVAGAITGTALAGGTGFAILVGLGSIH